MADSKENHLIKCNLGSEKVEPCNDTGAVLPLANSPSLLGAEVQFV